MIYNPKPMDKCKMIGICDATIKSLQEGRRAIVEVDYDKAQCLISRIYTHGLAQLMDDLRRLTQPECEHEFFLNLSHDRKTVSQKCRKCYLEQKLITATQGAYIDDVH